MKAKGSGQSALLLLDVISVLNRHHIPYAIIGAFAASFHGVVRASMDADAMISLEPTRMDVRALMGHLRKAGFKSIDRRGDVHDPIGAVIHVQDGFKNRVDLLMNIRGMAEDVFTRVIETDFMGTRIRVIGVEDFIAMKIFAGSPRDLSDAAGVLKVSGDRMDMTLAKSLVRKYGKGALDKLASLLKPLNH